MRREYEEAFAEVDEILKLMPVEISSKIPTQFKQIISKNRAKDYRVQIREPLELDEKNFKTETIVILGLIYRDFLADPEEKEELQLKDIEELKRIEQEVKEQYDINEVFKKKKNKKENKVEEEYETSMTIYKEPNFMKKFFNLIKGIFKRK